ncbi:hypothetical protein IEO21_10713 [Rhodonia placenta]|uniref:Uncharacterized protein n=1 Tax=Rhodonia placenta TaxID=104341 RepID=A0A8H7NRV4_9APHY|nr:hypothetical protein IEO21_10713 [Postia placenta]
MIRPRASASDRTPFLTHPHLQCRWNPEQRSTHHAKSSPILQDKWRTPICQSLRCQHQQGRHHLRPQLAQAQKPQDRLKDRTSGAEPPVDKRRDQGLEDGPVSKASGSARTKEGRDYSTPRTNEGRIHRHLHLGACNPSRKKD